MYKLTIKNSAGDLFEGEADKYDIRGNMVYIYKVTRAAKDGLARLDKTDLIMVREFISLWIEEIDDGKEDDAGEGAQDSA